MALSNNKIKYIRSLKDKKIRNEHQTFVAEGEKLVSDLLKTTKCQFLAALPEWFNTHPGVESEEMVVATPMELKKATFLKTPPVVIALFYQPAINVDEINYESSLSLVLDGIQDPGNVGTIIRIADWFGIRHIFCSPDTADVYNPKTVQATMGAIARVKTIYTPILSFLKENNDLPIYGTFLDGENVYTETLSTNGLIVMGSEGMGISNEVEKVINRRLFIPDYPKGEATAESLNVAVATAIVCSEFRRRVL